MKVGACQQGVTVIEGSGSLHLASISISKESYIGNRKGFLNLKPCP